MNKIQHEVETAEETLRKLRARRERLKETILKAITCDEALEKKEDDLVDYIKSVKRIRSTMPDFVGGTNLPTSEDLPDDWFKLQYDTLWELKRYFKGCIRRDGCKNRQWCVIDVVKLFIEIFVEQNPGSIKLEVQHARVYLYSSQINDYVRYDTPTTYRQATSRLGKFFNGLIRAYLNRVNRERNGHAGILHDKGIDVIAPYCCFNYWDYEDHKNDFVQPIKIYDDLKLVYLLNKSTDNFRKKFPKLYKIKNKKKTKIKKEKPVILANEKPVILVV